MKHGLTQDERRVRARVACAGIGLGLVILGVALWIARPTHGRSWTGEHWGAKLEAATLEAPAAGVATLEEVRLYGVPGSQDEDLDGIEMTLPETTANLPEGGMFGAGEPGAPEGAARAGAIVRHGGLFSPPGARDDEAAGARARRTLERGARTGGVDARAARADEQNEALVKRTSFRSCWEAHPGAAGKVSVKIVVDPTRGVSAYPVAASEVPEAVVSCVTARARSLPLHVPPDGGPRSFDVSSSYAPQVM
jgi:hypothetical protein